MQHTGRKGSVALFLITVAAACTRWTLLCIRSLSPSNSNESMLRREIGSEMEREIRLLGSDRNSWVVALKRRIPVWTSISGVFARVSRALPVLDIWPYRHHTNFELEEGGREMLRNDPGFYDNYEAVGQFPGVDSSWKSLETRFFGSFAGFARPLL